MICDPKKYLRSNKIRYDICPSPGSHLEIQELMFHIPIRKVACLLAIGSGRFVCSDGIVTTIKYLKDRHQNILKFGCNVPQERLE